MKKRFNNKVIVITGGASGIGKSIAMQLAALGGKIIIVDRNVKAGTKLVKNLFLKDQDAVYRNVDMTDVAEVEELFKYITADYGQIDYMFNCAGIFMAGEIRDTPLVNWETTINNNIWAVNNGTHFAYQEMLKQGNGHIINIASAAGLFPVPIMGIYGASKFAIVGITHELRNEAKDFNIKVSAVCPTVVNTPLYDTAIYNKLNKPKALKGRKALQTPELAAKRIIKGVVRNKATIHTAFSTKLGSFAYKVVPFAYNIFARKAIRTYRQSLRLKD